MVEKKMGAIIKELRSKKGLTREKISEMLGLSVNHYSALERGLYGVKPEFLVNIINILGCSADDIFCDVIDTGYVSRSSIISDMLTDLTPASKEKAFEIFEVVIKNLK